MQYMPIDIIYKNKSSLWLLMVFKTVQAFRNQKVCCMTWQKDLKHSAYYSCREKEKRYEWRNRGEREQRDRGEAGKEGIFDVVKARLT